MPDVRVAQAADAPRVAELMAAFRSHIGRDWPSDAEIRATVEALLQDRHDPRARLAVAAQERRQVDVAARQKESVVRGTSKLHALFDQDEATVRVTAERAGSPRVSWALPMR